MSVPDHSSLPLPDYDHLPVAAVVQHIRSLTADEVSQLLDYEREHANRPAVVQAIRLRLSELAAGAKPSGGGQQRGPEWPEPLSAGSSTSPAGTAPPAFPPPHGTPGQPARPKANRQAP